jgi:glycine oxidase
MMLYDHAIVGGGVIGLSLAWELGRHGRRVVLLDKGELGQEASWAGAGILPPGPPLDVASAKSSGELVHPYDQLRALSSARHQQWAEQLKEETGIDNGYRRCGGLYFAQRRGESAALRGWRLQLEEEGIESRELSADDVSACEPMVDVTELRYALSLPDEAQIRNPRHLKALAEAGRRLQVEFRTQCEVEGLQSSGGRITGLETAQGLVVADNYCFTSGAWTYPLLGKMASSLEIVPIRGQMILFQTETPLASNILNEGSRYLVPREDGFLLAGSSEEEAGYDKSTTEEILAQLRDFAFSWLPTLRQAREVRSWAGLRPGSFDGFPYLDRLPEVDNGFVAAGHFRSGLYLSPATAENMAQWMTKGEPTIWLKPFGLLRR